ncbi:MAG: DUF4783 domain-containing protein [Thermonemataceae bacterium]
MRQFFTLYTFFFFVLASTLTSYAQSSVITQAEAAIKIGSAKDLAKLFSETVEISFDGKKSNYSKTQAAFVMRDFFTKNAPNPAGFENYHRGNSGKSLNYTIVKYSSKNGAYRVFMKIKQYQGRYLIDSIDLNKE